MRENHQLGGCSYIVFYAIQTQKTKGLASVKKKKKWLNVPENKTSCKERRGLEGRG